MSDPIERIYHGSPAELLTQHWMGADGAALAGIPSAGNHPIEPLLLSDQWVIVNGEIGLGKNISIPTELGISAWHTLHASIELGRKGNAVAALTNAAQTVLTSNLYVNDTPAWIYANNGAGSILSIENDSLIYYNVPSGMAGNTATLAQRLMVSALGNMSVGNITPSVWEATYKGIELNYTGNAWWCNSNNVWLTANAFYNASSQWITPLNQSMWAVGFGGADMFRLLTAPASGAGADVSGALVTPFAIGRGQTLALQESVGPVTGTGITFPSSQLSASNVNSFDDYEEGTWSPTDASGAGLTFSDVLNGTYVKKGREVTLNAGYIQWPANASALHVRLGNLPYPTDSVSGSWISGASIGFPSTGYSVGLMVNDSTDTIYGYKPSTGATLLNSDMSMQELYGITITYTAAT